ncbi:aldehyde dehydrogenase [Mycolicibacterium novocastrense]|uniref:aldehyde dehydrogenase family protein n=1 Tax=Mycolicibacterium novocastrense TaxID=59813 RepID=UPI00074AA404|nr:aldehyde dehydrogenase [Mycolicibacterium novocastrense]KUH75950.1 aldehyde dehydrogenase [Mycolicibacterium novocastrense]KUH78731.1 aldehyde dehydrogenase [Mycolicibacterium novocastrense]
MPSQAGTKPADDRGAGSPEHSAGRVERHMLIDGVLSDGRSRQTFPSVNPATGAIMGFAPDCDVDDAQRAVAAARRAFDSTKWSTDITFRVKCLTQLHAALIGHREELRRLTVAETGATWRLTEGPYLDAPINAVGRHADTLAANSSTTAGDGDAGRGTHWTEKGPIGVVSICTGSSHPMRMAIAALGPALAAGCTVVLKGGSDAALTTLALGELIATTTEIPAGVVNLLASLNPAVDSTLASHRDVDLISFTGSVAAGRRLMVAASGAVKRVWMKPERKSTAIVLDDADVSTCTEQIALMATSHAGQGSAPISRVLVPAHRCDTAVGDLAKCLAAVRYGDPADVCTWMGPLISDRRRDEVDEMVKRAIASGATLVRGGGMVRPGYFYEPTLLTGVDPESEVLAAEVGGPVLVVVPYDDDRDAIRIANRSICGPSGVVFGSHERALAVARRVRTGRMSINGGNYLGPDSRFGYAEEHDIPADGSVELEKFLEHKTFAAADPEEYRRAVDF